MDCAGFKLAWWQIVHVNKIVENRCVYFEAGRSDYRGKRKPEKKIEINGPKEEKNTDKNDESDQNRKQNTNEYSCESFLEEAF